MGYFHCCLNGKIYYTHTHTNAACMTHKVCNHSSSKLCSASMLHQAEKVSKRSSMRATPLPGLSLCRKPSSCTQVRTIIFSQGLCCCCKQYRECSRTCYSFNTLSQSALSVILCNATWPERLSSSNSRGIQVLHNRTERGLSTTLRSGASLRQIPQGLEGLTFPCCCLLSLLITPNLAWRILIKNLIKKKNDPGL